MIIYRSVYYVKTVVEDLINKEPGRWDNGSSGGMR
jgi:hypothetical protein